MALRPLPPFSTLHPPGLGAASSKTQSRSAKPREAGGHLSAGAEGERAGVSRAREQVQGVGGTVRGAEGGDRGNIPTREVSVMLTATPTGGPWSPTGKRENLSGGARKADKGSSALGEGARSQALATAEARGSPSRGTVRPCHSSFQASRAHAAAPASSQPHTAARSRGSEPPTGPAPGPEAAADLDGLSVVDFYHVEVKTVDPFARGDESAAF